MRRAGLFLYDGNRKLVVPAGSDGVEPELLALFYGSRRPDWNRGPLHNEERSQPTVFRAEQQDRE
jgi:hypothetical protein